MSNNVENSENAKNTSVTWLNYMHDSFTYAQTHPIPQTPTQPCVMLLFIITKKWKQPKCP